MIDFSRDYLLQIDSPLTNNEVLKEFVWGKSREEQIKTLFYANFINPRVSIMLRGDEDEGSFI